jgi:serine/threonine-protein kinase
VKIGPYEILLELGRGGMGTVYLARLSGAGGFERLVAIKRAHAAALAQKDVHERFLREARLAAIVHHANVVGIHQVGEDQDGLYLVSDYVEGEALDRLIEGTGTPEPLPMAIALRIALDALAGLSAAHETVDGDGKPLGILHRDVSIENLLVGRDGVTRLTDFGIAKTSHGPGLTDAGTIHGKLMYLSPEYLQGAPSQPRDDTYAMGVTLWIALAGAFPYRARDNAALTREVLSVPIPSLGAVGLSVGPRLDAVLTRALSRDPNQRYQSASALLDALEEVSQRETPAARHREVADFVERVAGARLAQRRAKIQARRTAQDQESSVEAASKPQTAVVFDTEEHVTIAQARTRPAIWPWFALFALLGVPALYFATRNPRAPQVSEPAPVRPSAQQEPPAAAPTVQLLPPEASAPSKLELRARDTVVDASTPAVSEPSAAPDVEARGSAREQNNKAVRPRSARNRPSPKPEPPAAHPALEISTDNPYRK